MFYHDLSVSEVMLFKTVFVCLICVCAGNPDAKKLYDDLLHNYNRLIRYGLRNSVVRKCAELHGIARNGVGNSFFRLSLTFKNIS